MPENTPLQAQAAPPAAAPETNAVLDSAEKSPPSRPRRRWLRRLGVTFAALLVLLLEFGAPLIVKVIGSGFDSYTQSLATDLLRVTSPALIFMGLFAILSGTLYALHVFAWPAFATAVFNGAIVAYTLLLAPSPQARIFIEGSATRWNVIRPESGRRSRRGTAPGGPCNAARRAPAFSRPVTSTKSSRAARSVG